MRRRPARKPSTRSTGSLTNRVVRGDGGELIAEYSGANPIYLLTDERDSVVARSDSGSGVDTILRYDEYGRPAASNPGWFQYTGQMWLGAIGIYDYKNRNYHPRLGRFLQPDPIGYAGDGPNLYAYVLNDPVNFTDPLGLGSDDIIVTAPHLPSVWDLPRGGMPMPNIGGFSYPEPGEKPIFVTARRLKRVPQRVARLSSCQLRFAKSQLSARGLPTAHLSDVRFREGSSGGGLVAGYAHWRGNPAITRGSNVYVRPTDWQGVTDPTNPAGTMWAEVAHTAQYASDSDAAFGSEYVAGVLGGLLTGEGGWNGNIMEVVAHRIGAEMAAAWRNGGFRTCR